LWGEPKTLGSKAIERELQRYDFDLAMTLQVGLAEDSEVDHLIDLWPADALRHEVLAEALSEVTETGRILATHPSDDAGSLRRLTPFPHPGPPTSEIAIRLALVPPEESGTRADNLAATVLVLLHELREARAEGRC